MYKTQNMLIYERNAKKIRIKVFLVQNTIALEKKIQKMYTYTEAETNRMNVRMSIQMCQGRSMFLVAYQASKICSGLGRGSW